MTAKQRIERAVEKKYQKWIRGEQENGWLSITMAVTMAERARLKRGVRNIKADMENRHITGDYARVDGYLLACDRILKLWEA